MVYDTRMKDAVRLLRRKQTPSEEIFWDAVRNRKIEGKKFLRQFAIPIAFDGGKRFFIADFYCSESKLVVEIDGAVHEELKEYDSMRTEIIKHLGIRVIRFTNTEVETNLPEVLSTLKKAIYRQY